MSPMAGTRVGAVSVGDVLDDLATIPLERWSKVAAPRGSRIGIVARVVEEEAREVIETRVSDTDDLTRASETGIGERGGGGARLSEGSSLVVEEDWSALESDGEDRGMSCERFDEREETVETVRVGKGSRFRGPAREVHDTSSPTLILEQGGGGGERGGGWQATLSRHMEFLAEVQ
jgi:hypothetical protein